MKHTPGPWITNSGQIYPAQTGKTVAIIPYYDKENENEKANAHLIAAAPDMLHALRTVAVILSDHLDNPSMKAAYEQCQYAIGQAYGS